MRVFLRLPFVSDAGPEQLLFEQLAIERHERIKVAVPGKSFAGKQDDEDEHKPAEKAP